MVHKRYYSFIGAAMMALLLVTGCDVDVEGDDPVDTTATNELKTVPRDTVSYTDPPEIETAITLPIVDVFLADSTFLASITEVLNLTDAEINELRSATQASVKAMHSRDVTAGDGYGYTTSQAREDADGTVKRILGEERGEQFVNLIRLRWNGTDNGEPGGSMRTAEGGSRDSAGSMKMDSGSSGRMGGRRSADGSMANDVPTDTRIVVNIPAYRMDLFDNGKLVASYKIAVGYPEFPLPTGMRRAEQVIFNPTWTPPDVAWVNSSKSVKAGKTIAAGSKENPLGIAKIPIGLPSLIHSGKSTSVLGSFGSHGCVGLTDAQMREFLVALGKATEAKINDSLIKAYGKNPGTTKTVSFSSGMPVELRYKTIAVVGNELHIYRDIYDYNTNTEENLRSVLAGYGVALDQLDEKTYANIMDGLEKMSRDAQGQTDKEDPTGGDTAASKKEQRTITRSLKGGEKMVAIKLPAFSGEGYPAMAGS